MTMLEKSSSTLVTSSFSWKTPVVGALLQTHFCRLLLPLPELLRSLLLHCCCCWSCCCCWEVDRQRAVCFFLFSPLPLAPISPFLLLRPVLSRALPAELLWLLATLFDGLAPSASVVRCPCGPTKRLSTMSCVYSTHHFLRALPSFLSSTHSSCVVISSSPSCPSWA